jgi:restriction endonuclease S subunit
MILGEIAELTTGLNYMQKELSENPNSIPLIQVKDIHNNILNKSSVIRINKENIDVRLLLKNNDILFAAKGNRNFAYYYRGEFNDATVSSAFFIIRLIINDIMPEYLVWYLNSKQAKKFFRENVRGTFIPNISIAVMSKMNIPIPDIKTQETIIKLGNGQKLEKSLIEQIVYKRELLINEIINRKIINSYE